ncbi:MAG: hypothetical protein EXR78_06270 [Deltaproteobacteria bacterium]|nr:hypothetical protein [Deltaproteobacteria bacterium]
MGEVLLDPTDRVDRGEKGFAPRLDTLAGKTVGLLDINKSKGVYFLDRLEEVLRTQYGVTEVLRRKKVSPGRMMSEQLKTELVDKCDAVIEALSD